MIDTLFDTFPAGDKPYTLPMTMSSITYTRSRATFLYEAQ